MRFWHALPQLARVGLVFDAVGILAVLASIVGGFPFIWGVALIAVGSLCTSIGVARKMRADALLPPEHDD